VQGQQESSALRPWNNTSSYERANKSIGVIYIESSNLGDGIKLLEIYSTQAASSINNAFLHSLINMKKEELDRTYQELRKRYIDTIEALRLTVDAKDIYTRVIRTVSHTMR